MWRDARSHTFPHTAHARTLPLHYSRTWSVHSFRAIQRGVALDILGLNVMPYRTLQLNRNCALMPIACVMNAVNYEQNVCLFEESEE
jgi:hypothetical protein